MAIAPSKCLVILCKGPIKANKSINEVTEWPIKPKEKKIQISKSPSHTNK